MEGVVQGVGFRPFVKRLADRLRVPGLTFNTAGGLIVEFQASSEDEATSFVELLKAEAPPAAKIERCEMEELAGRWN